MAGLYKIRAMKENKYTRFCALEQNGCSKEETIQTLGISPRTYYNYLNRLHREGNDLIPENYYREVKRGFRTKDSLAARFRTTRQTINKYENKIWDAPARISRGLHVSTAMSDDHIAGYLHLSHAETAQHTNNLPTLKSIVTDLERAITTLEDFTEFEPECAGKIQRLRHASELITSCIERRQIFVTPSDNFGEM